MPQNDNAGRRRGHGAAIGNYGGVDNMMVVNCHGPGGALYNEGTIRNVTIIDGGPKALATVVPPMLFDLPQDAQGAFLAALECALGRHPPEGKRRALQMMRGILHDYADVLHVAGIVGTIKHLAGIDIGDA